MTNREYSMIEKEMKSLREELKGLKGCQITFLTAAATATGGIIGLAIGGRPLSIGEIYLSPLMILLPAWWIFFDKATSITRIVGYYGLLESLYLGQLEAKTYLGWERSLQEERRRGREITEDDIQTYAQATLSYKLEQTEAKGEKALFEGIVSILLVKVSHKYWVIAFNTFTLLSLACVWGGWRYCEGRYLFQLVFSIFFTVSFMQNARVLWQLIWGKSSYNWNDIKWRVILRVALPIDTKTRP